MTALRRAGLGDWLGARDEGTETRVGDGGRAPSGAVASARGHTVHLTCAGTCGDRENGSLT